MHQEYLSSEIHNKLYLYSINKLQKEQSSPLTEIRVKKEMVYPKGEEKQV